MNENLEVTVAFGVGNELRLSVPPGTTVCQAMEQARAQLGFGTNVQARVEGVAQPDQAPLADGDRVEVTPQPGRKA